jgi:LPS sulfotransferase NodH
MLSGELKQWLTVAWENVKYSLNIRDRLFGHKDYVKFIIIARSRTGSNLLISYLNKHESVIALGEMFQNLYNRDSQHIWNKIFSKKSSKIKAVGFKIFYYHPEHSDDHRVWEFIKSDPQIRIIHLKRLNVLRTIVSQAIADKTGAYSKRWYNTAKVELEDKRITLNRTEVLKKLEQVKKWENDTDLAYRGHKLLNIQYEELVSEKNGCMKKVFTFLGLEPTDTTTNMKRQNSESLHDLVINYDELKKDFKDSDWSYLFDLEN